MLHHLKSYAKFLWESKNKYGVHSPFVYDFLTKGLTADPGTGMQIPLHYRSGLEKNHEKIKVKEFGAGSRVFKSQERQISKIAATAGINKKWGKILFQSIAYFQPDRILEIGTSLGIATAHMAAAAPDARIISLEGCPETALIAASSLKEAGMYNIEMIIGEFKDTLPKVLDQNSFDLVYFDGNHRKAPTLAYFNQCLMDAEPSSVFIFDDIHWSAEMEEAWQTIKSNPKVSLSIDAYQWGMVFFHQGRAKEHFTLRI